MEANDNSEERQEKYVRYSQRMELIRVLDRLSLQVHENAKAHGWWDKPKSDAEIIALVHSELSEALEYLRKDPRTPSNHISNLLGVEEEIADVIIRLLDWSAYRGYRVGEAIIAKHNFNINRPHRHGNKQF